MTLDYTFERRLQLAKEEKLEKFEQLTREKERLTLELEHAKKLLAEHGIEETQ